MVGRLDVSASRHAESAGEMIPDRDAGLGACLGEAQEGVAAITASITLCPGTDLPARDVTADVVLRAVGVERDLCRSSTISNSALLACSRATKPVRRRKMRSNRARNARHIRRLGLRRYALRLAQKSQISPRDCCCAARWWSLKVSGLCTSRSACTRHSACRPMLNCPASSLRTTASHRNLCAWMLPHNASSVTARCGFGVTRNAASPSRSRCACQVPWSSNRVAEGLGAERA